MSRTSLSATNITASKAAVVYPRFFAEFDFSGGWVRAWSGIGTLVVTGLASRSFTGLGTLGGVSSVREAADISAQGTTFTLSGVPSSLIASALGENYRGRPCTLWVGFMNSSEVLLDTPYELFTGFMDSIEIDDAGDSSSISIHAESHLAALRRPRVSRYTHEEQIRLFPGDLGLEYLAKLWERPIIWGQANKRSSPTITSAEVANVISPRAGRW